MTKMPSFFLFLTPSCVRCAQASCPLANEPISTSRERGAQADRSSCSGPLGRWATGLVRP